MLNIEDYFIKLSLSYERLSDDIYVINDSERGIYDLLVIVNGNIVTFKLRLVKVLNIKNKDKENFLIKVLKLNYKMIYCSYSIDEDEFICLVDSFDLSDLRVEEMQNSIDEISISFMENKDFFS